jgi:hypothetical protein
MFRNFMSSSAASKCAQGSVVFIAVEYGSFTNDLPDGNFFFKGHELTSDHVLFQQNEYTLHNYILMLVGI